MFYPLFDSEKEISMITIETERLTIRPMTLDDMPDMFAIYSSELALKFVPSAVHQSLEETIKHFECRMDSHLSICLKGQGRVIGALNIIHSRIPGLGYIVHPDYWGQGITVEAMHAFLDYAFAHFDQDRYELWIDENNSASLRVAQKLGFKLKGRIPHKYPKNAYYHHFLVWGMLKSEWLAEESASPEPTFYRVEPVLHVHDIVASTEYYRDKLGFNVDFLYGDPPTHAGVSRGEWTANMVSIQLTKIPAEQDIIPATNLHIFVDTGLDMLFELYREQGVSIVSEPDDKPWGMREFTVKDINGHVLIFARYI